MRKISIDGRSNGMNEIETIFCKLLKCDRSRLYLDQKNLLLDPKKLNRLEKILEKGSAVSLCSIWSAMWSLWACG